MRAAAAELLGLVGEARDAESLADLLRDPAAEVRARVSQALGRVGAEKAVEGLRRAMSDRIPYVRTHAAHALGAAGDREAEPLLLAQARDDDYDPAHAAAQALFAAAPQTLTGAARRPDASVHLHEAADLLAARGA